MASRPLHGAEEAPQSLLLFLCWRRTPAPGPLMGGYLCTPREAQVPGQRRPGGVQGHRRLRLHRQASPGETAG